MRKTKRTALERKGWKIGDAEKFLELTPEEVAYVEMKLRLSDSLRKRRQRRKLTQTQFAKLIKSSQSRVAKMEAGDPSVSIDLIVRALFAMGTTTRELGKVVSARPLESAP